MTIALVGTAGDDVFLDSSHQVSDERLQVKFNRAALLLLVTAHQLFDTILARRNARVWNTTSIAVVVAVGTVNGTADRQTA
jgi:hypothetical protein